MYDDYRRDYRHDQRQDYTQRYDAGYTREFDEPRQQSRIDAKRLWAGGAATALVAALVAFICLMIVRGIFGLAVLAPTEAGLTGDVSTVGLCTLAAVSALVGTALMHLLLISVPSPQTFFGVIVGLIVAVLVLLPFTGTSEITTKIATSAVFLVTGCIIGFLITTVSRSAERWPAS